MTEKGFETKKMISEAANKLFAEKGFKDVSMSDICKATGLSRGGLYRHYSSTSDIFKEIIEKEYSFDESIEKGNSALDILRFNLKLVEEEILKNQDSLSLAIYEYASIADNKKIFSLLEAKAKKRWMKLIEYGIKTGEFSNVDSEQVSEMILYYYQGLRMWSRIVDIKKKSAGFYRENIIKYLVGEKNGN